MFLTRIVLVIALIHVLVYLSDGFLHSTGPSPYLPLRSPVRDSFIRRQQQSAHSLKSFRSSAFHPSAIPRFDASLKPRDSRLFATAGGSSSSTAVQASPHPIIVSSPIASQTHVHSAPAPSGGPTAAYLAGMFTLWYGFNAAYNVYNAHMKRAFPFPLHSACLHLLVGLFYIFPLWMFGFREAPNLQISDVFKLLPIAVLNALGHASAVVAMFQHGGGSFTHVIKASEPVVSVILGILLMGVWPKPLTALSLLPITYGVAYASTLGNLNWSSMGREFTSKAAIMAMISNVAFALRSIFRKNLSHDFKARTRLDPSNEHAVSTMLSLLLTIPFAVMYESPDTVAGTLQSLSNRGLLSQFVKNVSLCGLSFYLYNDLQNMVLGSLGPVPTAVGNTLKRVVIFAALYLFTPGETFPPAKIFGCAVAIAGCLAFAIADSKKI